MEDLGLRSTVVAGCALGVRHPVPRKLVGQRWRIASADDRLLKDDLLHHEAGNHFRTFGVLDALARRACRAFLEEATREEVSCCVAAVIDVDEATVKNNIPFKKKSRSQPETLPIEQDVSKKELELPQQLWTQCKRETLVLALRLKGAKPLILRLPRDFVCLSR